MTLLILMKLGELTVNNNSTKTSFSTFLYNIQQPNKTLIDPAYFIVLKELQSNQKILSPTLETTRKEDDHSPN